MDPSTMDQLENLPKDIADDKIASMLPPLPPLSQLIAFYTLHLLAIPLLFILAMTIIFSKRLHRHPVSWIFFLSMMMSSFFYSFLIWAGQPRNPHPSDGVRIASAVFAIIAPTVQGGTVLALVMKVWTVLVDLVEPRFVKPVAKCLAWDPFLLSFPWLIVFPILIYAAVTASTDVIWTQRLYFYCTILPQHDDIHVTAMMISMIELALTIVFSIWSAVLYFSVSRSIRSRKGSDINADLIFRVMTFTCWIIMTLVVSAVEYRTRTIHKPLAILITTNPIACFLIFASQRDMLKVWGLSRFARYFNCTQSTDFSGSSDRRSSTRNTHDRRELDNIEGRKEFSKLSSVDDIENTNNYDFGDYEFQDTMKKDDSYEGEDIQVLHQRHDQHDHLSPTSPTQNFHHAIGSRPASAGDQYAAASPSPSQYTNNSPFSNYFPSPSSTPVSGATTNRHAKKDSGSIPTRKPVPSFASYELPPVPTPTSPVSPVSSPGLNRNGSHHLNRNN